MFTTKIPTNLIAALSHTQSWPDERRLGLMIKLLKAFPEKFEELTENVYWENFLPLIARDKKERNTKYKNHEIFRFFAKEWNENYREYIFSTGFLDRVQIINFMTRRREVRFAQIFTPAPGTLNFNRIFNKRGILSQKKLNRRIDHLLSTDMLVVVRVNNPLGLFVSISNLNPNDRSFINKVVSDGDLNMEFGELRQLQGLEISQIDLYKQMFVAKVEQIYHIFDQRMTNNGHVMTILEPIKIPYPDSPYSYLIPEDPILITPTNFIGDESNAPDGFSMYPNDADLEGGVILSKIYKVETASRIVYCIFGYFGEHKRTVIVPQKLVDFYFRHSFEI